ncbi:HECT-domain-containing protein [Pisolithus croceorrhizus]|nr:HECT-domain-containing protein [Pisolithus croceorrhizus]
MLPLFGDEHRRRRTINLGGSQSVTSQAAILEQARALRLKREVLRRREESALKIQSWWRGTLEARSVRHYMRQLFLQDMTSLMGLRCLVFIGQDDDLLRQWSAAMSADDHLLFGGAAGQDKAHWVTLLCRVSVLLIKSVAKEPSSHSALTHLQVLCKLLDPSYGARVLGLSDFDLPRVLTQYVMQYDLYQNIRSSIEAIAIDSKDDPAIPYLVKLVYLPFSNVPPLTELFTQYMHALAIHILTIPLLPYRMPLRSLSQFSAKLPLAYLQALSSCTTDIVMQTSISAQINIIANLLHFTPPRYAILPLPTLTAYIQLLRALLSALPVHALDPPLPDSKSPTWEEDSDVDDEHVPGGPAIPRAALPVLDARTRKKLQTLPSGAHLNTLLKLTHQHPQLLPDMVALLVTLHIVWPTAKDEVLGTLLLYGGGGLVREIYRDQVRPTPLGRDDNIVTIMDPSLQDWWPPLLLLTELYTHTLRTMGDDEFFSNSRTLLTLNELVPFSRTLFNIAFTLYWRDEHLRLQDTHVPGLSLRWTDVRERLTKCLQAIHARDSRRPFMPPNHWSVGTQIDMSSFIDAAVHEEQQTDEVSGPLTTAKGRQTYFSHLFPRLGILSNIPFAIPFETRVHIFRLFVQTDMTKRGFDQFSRFNRVEVSVRRGHIAQDGYDKLSGVNLRAQIAITFIDQFGEPEAGIDGGGVFKEFFTSLCKEVFDTDRGLWLETKKNEIYPNPHSYASEAHSLSWYRFIGRILGKALYDGILVEVAFAGFFLAKWLDKQSFLDDLASLDPDLYQGLVFLKNYTGNVEDLSLNFTVATEEFGVTKAVDLIPNGSNVAVTRENRLQYICLVSHYRLSTQIKLQSEAFFEGLSEMIDPKWLRMFNQQELQILLGGANSPIDFGDLRQHTQYGGLYGDEDPTIRAFWKVMESFDQEQRRAFLRFVTSCSRPPLLGFKQLTPNFAIRDAGDDQHRLPTASTCVNLLKLPRYTNERVLREKLLQAISSGAGFDLS